MEFGGNAHEETSYELEKSMKEAKEAGMTDRNLKTLRNIIWKMIRFQIDTGEWRTCKNSANEDNSSQENPARGSKVAEVSSTTKEVPRFIFFPVGLVRHRQSCP